MKKNTKNTFSKSFSILAAAALSMTLISGQVLPTYAGSSSGIESGAVIPDNITIDNPTALSNVTLPSNSYGSLSWVDGSYVPEKRVQSCAVVFKPSSGADLSGLPGWDSSSGTLTGYVTVVVSSFDSSSDENEGAGTSGEDSEDSSNEETAENGNVNESDSYENNSDTEDDNNKDNADVTEIPNAQESSSDKTDTDKKGDTADNDNTDEKKDNAEDSTTDNIADKDNTDEDTADNVDPDVTETPEVTVTPSENENKADQDKDPNGSEDKNGNNDADAAQTPETTVTPAEDDSRTDSSADTDKKDSKEDSKEDETPDVTETPEEDKGNIFDRKDEEEDKRPQNAGTDLTETEKEQTAIQNHTCDGITVSGIDLPWYVQFRVSGGEDYEFTNAEDATIFKSYEFELWDTQKNTEYKIPDGEYISVNVPVKAGYTYSIEHLLDNGAMETIIPSVDGGTMTFSTHSFSPFGIAGSKSLVGPDAGTDSSSDVTKTTPAAASSTDTVSSSDTSGITDSDGTENTDSAADLDTSADLSSGSADLEEISSQNSTSGDESEDESSQATSKKQVNTGDNTQILPFVILFIAAAVVAGVAVFFKKRKK